MTPGLFIPVSSSAPPDTFPNWQNVNGVLARHGWSTFLATPLHVAETYEVKTACLWLPHGTRTPVLKGCREIQVRDEYGDQAQDFEAYRHAKYAGILQDTLLDNDALASELERFDTAGCEVIPYYGPPRRELAKHDVQDSLEPFRNTPVQRIFVDGAGARDDIKLADLIKDEGFEMLDEPQRQRTDNAGNAIPDRRHMQSFTLSRTLEHPEAFYPDYPAGVTRWWLDQGVFYADPAAYWRRFDEAVSAGFTPMLPPDIAIWNQWQLRSMGDGGAA